MITILHGDNSVQSRQALVEMMDRAKADGATVARYDAKKLTVPQLEDALGTQELFSAHTLVVVEGLFGLPKSRMKDVFMDKLAHSSADAVLWEQKSLSQTQLKPFPKAEQRLFKTSPAVFAWVDALRPGNLRQCMVLLDKAEKQESIEMCFAMLVRQIRLLIQIKNKVAVKVAPFALAKLTNQAKAYAAETLFRAHEKLLEIDELQKTSRTFLSLRAQIDLFMRELLE